MKILKGPSDEETKMELEKLEPYEIINRLVRTNADIDNIKYATDKGYKDWRSLFYMSLIGLNSRYLNFSIQMGIDVNSPDLYQLNDDCINITPLMVASHSYRIGGDENLDVVKILIKNGADLLLTNGKGDSALRYALLFNHLEVAQYLLDNGALLTDNILKYLDKKESIEFFLNYKLKNRITSKVLKENRRKYTKI